MYNKILVPSDGSTLSKKAVTHAIGLAQLSGAELLVLKVVPRYPMSYFEGGMALPMPEINEIEQQWSAHAQGVVQTAVKQAEKHGVTAKGLTVKSDVVSEAIISAAKKHRCDLIVMASHGRSGVKRLLLGSETLHVLTHSHTPVLVLR